VFLRTGNSFVCNVFNDVKIKLHIFAVSGYPIINILNIKMMNKRKVVSVVFGIAYIIFLTGSIFAQNRSDTPDSLRLITIDEVVITANRYDSKVLRSGASVGVLKAHEIESVPAQNFSGILNYIPGIFSSSTDGMGLNPQVNIRGFYGGGEAEYLRVLIDGIPVNDLETGLANWNQIPLDQVSKVELLKGGSSTLYGDAAIGGVLNIRTLKTDKNFTTANIGYGSYNTYNIGTSHGGIMGNGNYELYLNNNATDGFREHSKWNSINFGGRVKLPLNKNSTLAFSTFNQILKSDDPGFLSDTMISTDREQSQVIFREDGNDNQKYLANIEFNNKVNSDVDLRINLCYQHKNTQQYRTFGQYPYILQPISDTVFIPTRLYDTTIFANTKKRALTTDQANLAIRIISRIPELNATITGGIEADYGGYSNEYHDIFRGFDSDFSNQYIPYDSPDTKGSGYRVTSATYLNGEIRLAEPLTLFAGVRYDFIADDFEGKIPDTSLSKNNSQISPKIALSLSTGESDVYAGSIFLSYSHAFKAPTIDQRTDFKQLTYYVFIDAGAALIPMEIQGNPLANAQLKPQTSLNYELGTYQYYKFSETLSGEFNLTGYYIKVRDEIDYDQAAQQYKNILNTEHTGLEISLRMNVKSDWSGYLNYNFSEAKFEDGDNKGKILKGTPKNVYAAGVSYSPETGFGASLFMNGADGIFLDDANTEKLKTKMVFNVRIHYKFSQATVYFDVNNIFGTSYNSTGYLIENAKYLYPAAGRLLRAGVNLNF